MGTGHYLQHRVIDDVPFNTMLNMKISDFDAESVTLYLPEQDNIHSQNGGTHPSAQYAVAEAASRALLERCFSDLLEEGFISNAVEATIQYRKDSVGNLKAVATLPQEQQQFIRASLKTRKRANFAVDVDIIDESGITGSIMHVKWMVLPERG